MRSRVERCRAAAAESGLPVEIGPPLALPGAPADAPPAAVAAYRLFEWVAGPLFRFDCPDELRSIEGWRARSDIEMLLPMPIELGWEMWSWQSVTKGRLGVQGGEGICLDPVKGDVYYVEDWAWFQRNIEWEAVEDVHHPIAPDAVTFFADWVFGPRYPELVSLVLGPGLLEHRIRKGRHKGELTDAWLRLLQRAELLEERTATE
ncbi:hypothetical protein [Actinoplanes lobatus]|uniref:Uncharacterized protein n=1 Tax=Actinoplanes lobatus TaxID=113568 RepID=A0A7W7MFS4_9ACTN|nr:hypothetical protein [Actinoplanes lobatus]MBB4748652.1 hypothetical protein [Actinoplanes lobatus]